MRKIKYFINTCVVIAAIGLFSGLNAQTTTSTIEGTVTDPNGAVISGATVKATGTTLATERTAVTDSEGFYRLAALPAGTYDVTIAQTGFIAGTYKVELTLNRVARFDAQLKVGGGVEGDVTVTSESPLLEPNASSTGATITPQQIQDYPVNGREYLDLLQLVPGVAINRQATDRDNANPVLGERSGNNNFFIDGQPNKDTVNGGPAAQFNQETIAEFQVLTTGYKAEFGLASGAIVNVITKSGGNQFHGVGSFFHRNEFLDSVNSRNQAVTDPLHLRRFDYSLAGGGPIWKDRIFFFGSSERITEDRAIDFVFPTFPSTPANTRLLQLLHAQEDPLDGPQRLRETRNFLKLNENFGRHQLVQEMNYTNTFTRGAGSGIPSSRRNTSGRRLMLGFGDTMLLGDQGNPWIVTVRGSFRGEPSDDRPAAPDIAGVTSLNSFSALQVCPPTCGFFGVPVVDPPPVTFGSATTLSFLDQKYSSFSSDVDKLFRNHEVKFGWQFLRTKVDGLDSQTLTNQVFATVDDYLNLGAINSGIFLLLVGGGPTPAANEIHLRNNYNGLYVQDDWKLLKKLTLNLGLRWDHDSQFTSTKNFSPRLGFAWTVTPKTVIRSHFGIFYDQFRLGLVQQIPAFGGSDRRTVQSLYFPRGFYGSPSLVSSLAFAVGLPGPCISNRQTDSQIAASGATCPFGGPMVGVDRLNNVVAPGHAPIPANTAINISNVQALTGLTPAQYLTQAAAAIGQPAGYFEWGQFGVLNNPIIPPAPTPTAVDSTFKTPHTLSFGIGVQRQLTKDMVVEADYYHREMHDLLGVRLSNLAFRSRVAGIGRSFDPAGSPELPTFGPFFEGKYDALVINFNKRLSHRYLIGANYTYAKATDNSLGIFSFPTDQFIGIAPVVTEPCATGNPTCTRQTNANGSFISRNGNFVAQAGTFINGPDLDKGPSNLALDHIFQINGLVNLPWKFQISGIFRAQSGFHFSQFDASSRDPDGNGNFNGIDFTAGRNAFTAPPFVNLDMRFSKQFKFGERVQAQLILEFFNLLNRSNPRTVFNRANDSANPFGSADLVLAPREGQVGFRISF
jgi:outer membrane receptor protein involved in Fe transport